ncbi:hypothetical protein BC831DRAFT_512608 [Entophlyctis helioformis]|nr:hypothetical protein BC831DRAFT_512608 [Entophlyctis helioformis]
MKLFGLALFETAGGPTLPTSPPGSSAGPHRKHAGTSAAGATPMPAAASAMSPIAALTMAKSDLVGAAGSGESADGSVVFVTDYEGSAPAHPDTPGSDPALASRVRIASGAAPSLLNVKKPTGAGHSPASAAPVAASAGSQSPSKVGRQLAPLAPPCLVPVAVEPVSVVYQSRAKAASDLHHHPQQAEHATTGSLLSSALSRNPATRQSPVSASSASISTLNSDTAVLHQQQPHQQPPAHAHAHALAPPSHPNAISPPEPHGSGYFHARVSHAVTSPTPKTTVMTILPRAAGIVSQPPFHHHNHNHHSAHLHHKHQYQTLSVGHQSPLSSHVHRPSPPASTGIQLRTTSAPPLSPAVAPDQPPSSAGDPVHSPPARSASGSAGLPPHEPHPADSHPAPHQPTRGALSSGRGAGYIPSTPSSLQPPAPQQQQQQHVQQIPNGHPSRLSLALSLRRSKMWSPPASSSSSSSNAPAAPSASLPAQPPPPTPPPLLARTHQPVSGTDADTESDDEGNDDRHDRHASTTPRSSGSSSGTRGWNPVPPKRESIWSINKRWNDMMSSARPETGPSASPQTSASTSMLTPPWSASSSSSLGAHAPLSESGESRVRFRGHRRAAHTGATVLGTETSGSGGGSGGVSGARKSISFSETVRCRSISRVEDLVAAFDRGGASGETAGQHASGVGELGDDDDDDEDKEEDDNDDDDDDGDDDDDEVQVEHDGQVELERGQGQVTFNWSDDDEDDSDGDGTSESDDDSKDSDQESGTGEMTPQRHASRQQPFKVTPITTATTAKASPARRDSGTGASTHTASSTNSSASRRRNPRRTGTGFRESRASYLGIRGSSGRPSTRADTSPDLLDADATLDSLLALNDADYGCLQPSPPAPLHKPQHMAMDRVVSRGPVAAHGTGADATSAQTTTTVEVQDDATILEAAIKEIGDVESSVSMTGYARRRQTVEFVATMVPARVSFERDCLDHTTPALALPRHGPAFVRRQHSRPPAPVPPSQLVQQPAVVIDASAPMTPDPEPEPKPATSNNANNNKDDDDDDDDDDRDGDDDDDDDDSSVDDGHDPCDPPALPLDGPPLFDELDLSLYRISRIQSGQLLPLCASISSLAGGCPTPRDSRSPSPALLLLSDVAPMVAGCAAGSSGSSTGRDGQGSKIEPLRAWNSESLLVAEGGGDHGTGAASENGEPRERVDDGRKGAGGAGGGGLPGSVESMWQGRPAAARPGQQPTRVDRGSVVVDVVVQPYTTPEAAADGQPPDLLRELEHLLDLSHVPAAGGPVITLAALAAHGSAGGDGAGTAANRTEYDDDSEGDRTAQAASQDAVGRGQQPSDLSAMHAMPSESTLASSDRTSLTDSRGSRSSKPADVLVWPTPPLSQPHATSSSSSSSSTVSSLRTVSVANSRPFKSRGRLVKPSRHEPQPPAVHMPPQAVQTPQTHEPALDKMDAHVPAHSHLPPTDTTAWRSSNSFSSSNTSTITPPGLDAASLPLPPAYRPINPSPSSSPSTAISTTTATVTTTAIATKPDLAASRHRPLWRLLSQMFTKSPAPPGSLPHTHSHSPTPTRRIQPI